MLWKLPNISLPVDYLFSIGGYPVANTLILSVLDALIIIAIFYVAARRPKLVPGPVQNVVEWASQLLLNLCEDVAGKEKGRRFFPLIATIFLYILLGNLWEVIPGVETIGTPDREIAGCAHVSGVLLTGSISNCIKPWLRPPSTDLNFTIGLAIISVIVTQFYGFRILGFRGQVSRYLIFNEGPIGLIVGLLEFVLEFVRIISLGFRLFGNLFAGDLVLLVIGFLIPAVGPIPFYFLEVFVGFIQAFVFAFLTLLFLTLGTVGHDHADAEEEHAAEQAEAEHGVAREAVPA